MRRNQATAQASGTVDDDIPLVCGDIAMQVGQHQVTVRGETVFFLLKESELPRIPSCRTRAVMTRHQLIDRIWGSDYVATPRRLTCMLKRVRSKIEEDPAHPKYLTTVRGPDTRSIISAGVNGRRPSGRLFVVDCGFRCGLRRRRARSKTT